jgi:hypothetical protein
MIVKKYAQVAATFLGIVIFLLVLFAYGPILATNLSSIGDELNYSVDTLAFSGAALLLADALPKEDHSHA